MATQSAPNNSVDPLDEIIGLLGRLEESRRQERIVVDRLVIKARLADAEGERQRAVLRDLAG